MSHSEEQARAQYETIAELVERLREGDDEVMDDIYADALMLFPWRFGCAAIGKIWGLI